jgi:hypothetical protein
LHLPQLLGVEMKMIRVRQQDMRHGSPRILSRMRIQHALAAAAFLASWLHISNASRPVTHTVDLPVWGVVAEL